MNTGVVIEYQPLVHQIAWRMAKRLPSYVDVEDLIQAGMEGLLSAHARYTGDRGAAFATYAGIRIRGAILDGLRESDWAPRSLRRESRAIVHAIAEIEGELGRDARAEEVAQRLGLDLDTYHRLLGDIDAAFVPALSAHPLRAEQAPSEWAGPEETQEEEDLADALRRAIASLPERERLIIERTYYGGQGLREVGRALGVSASRVCQLRTQAEARLRARLKGAV